MREVIEKVRQHSVTLKSQVSTVLITALVLDGWASALDHDVRVLEHVKELVALEDWRGRLGRTVDHFMRAGALLTA